MDEKAKLEISTMIYPQKIVVAVCSECGGLIEEVPYITHLDSMIARQVIRKDTYSCPYCKAAFQKKDVKNKTNNKEN